MSTSTSTTDSLPALGLESGVVAICNKALRYLGVAEILSFNQKSREAELCAAHYSGARDELLELYPWSFATRLQSLAPLPDTSTSYPNQHPANLKYSHRLPVDCLRLRHIFGNPTYLLAGRVLYSDSTTLKALLTVRVEDATLFPALFVEALARRLAADLAVPLLNNSRLEQTMQQRFNEALSSAKLADALEDGCKNGLEASLGLYENQDADGEQNCTGSDSWLGAR